MRTFISWVFLVALVATADASFAADVNSPVGTWRLISWQVIVDNGPPQDVFGSHPRGFLILTKEGRLIVLTTAESRKRGMSDQSYGCRFVTTDRTIVISGDTDPTQTTIDTCHGCDVLIHEAHPPAWIATRPPTFQRFAAKYHTTTAQLADLAKQAKPRLLIIYHYPIAPEDVFADMSVRYDGEFVVGRDLDIY